MAVFQHPALFFAGIYFDNTIKHAGAGKLMISVQIRSKEILLTVEDNGKGFDPKMPDHMSVGIGLQSIRNRVELLNGKINLQSGHNGTVVSIKLPLNKKML